MPESITISKSNSSLPPYLDFKGLKKEGIEYIEQLAGKNWTDYNLHDPGITILEVLCYALMDVGYRINLPIEDLLTPDAEQLGKVENNFFTPSEILTNNPLTINDYRKLLMDIPGVKNAWLVASEIKKVLVDDEVVEKEFPIPNTLPTYLTWMKDKAKLTMALPEEGAQEIRLRGLYRVYIEMEESFLVNSCGQVGLDKQGVLDNINKTLNQHRNLCEDFQEIIVLGEEGIGICAEIELTSNANPVEVTAKIYEKIDAILSPQPQYYTLQQLLERGTPIEEIFEGRPHTQDSHGFIDTEELEQIEKKEVLHTSDFYNVLIDIDEIVAIKHLEISGFIDGVRQTEWQKWHLGLADNFTPVLETEKSSLSFFKGVFPLALSQSDKNLAQKKYRERKATLRKGKLNPYALDLTIPYGNFRELSEYYSIQHEFPLVYGIGEEGLPSTATKEQQIKAKQLKGFLLLFDQCVANYLGNLANLREIFALFGSTVQHTYFPNPLESEFTPKVDEYISGYGTTGQDSYEHQLGEITETKGEYLKRREKFLDHLLARFSEDFSAYETLVTSLGGDVKALTEEVIEDKEALLKSYPDISRNRGKGVDYLALLEDEKAGLQKRVSKLLALNECPDTKKLNHFEVIKECEAFYFAFVNCGEVLLKSTQSFKSEEEAYETYEAICGKLSDEKNYKISDCHPYRFWFESEDGEVLAEHPTGYHHADERDFALDQLLVFLQTGGFPFRIKKIEGLFGFELKNANGKLLLKNDRGYFSIQEAQKALCDVLALGRAFENYGTKPCQLEEFGFELKHGEETLALHLDCYESEEQQVRSVRKLVATLLLNGHSGDVAIEKGYFLLEIRRGDELVFIHKTQFTSSEEAQAACEGLLALAKDKGNYLLIDEKDKCEFGFALKNEEGERIAEHKDIYESPEERDAVIDDIVSFLHEMEGDPCEIVEVPDAFYFTISGQDEELLLQGEQFPTEEEAWFALGKAAMAIRCIENYETAFDEEKCAYHIKLNGSNGEPLAVHPSFFPDEEEPKEKIKQIFEYLQEDLLNICTTGMETEYYSFLQNEEGKNLLSSAIGYADLQDAHDAFVETLAEGRLEERYSKTYSESEETFSFKLLNACGEELAVSTRSFPTEEKRDEGIFEVMKFLLTKGIPFSADEKGEKYQFKIEGEQGQVYLEGSQWIESEKEVWESIAAVLRLGIDKENYLLTGSEEQCNLSFEIVDVEGLVLAHSPKEFDEPSQRDRFLEKVCAYLASFIINPECVHSDGLYKYHILTTECEDFLVSETIYHSKRQALWALRDALSFTPSRDNYIYTGKRGNYSFSLCDNDEVNVASHPQTYKTVKEQKENLSSMQYELDNEGIEPTIVKKDEGLRFVLTGTGDDCGYLLKSTRIDHEVPEHLTEDCGCSGSLCIDAPEMWEAAEDFAFLAQVEESFYPIDDDCAGKFSFVVAEDDYHLAHSPIVFRADDASSSTPSTLVSFMKEIAVSVKELPVLEFRFTTGEKGIWEFTILSNNEEVLKSIQPYFTEEEAHAGLEDVLEFAKSLAYYRANNNAIHLLDNCGNLQAKVLGELAQPEDAEKKINELACTFNHYLQIKIEGFREKFWYSLWEKDLRVLQSAKSFSTLEKAADTFAASKEYFEQLANYEVFKNEEGAYSFRVLNEGEIKAESKTYDSQVERDQALERAKILVNCEGFHLVEHILLRPHSHEDKLFPVQLDKACALHTDWEESTAADPYSFWVSIVIPYWTKRFQKMAFRQFFEDTLRREAPAHVALKICWLDPKQMCDFEKAYDDWKKEKQYANTSCALSSVQNQLKQTLTSLQNFYPSASRIRGCEDGDIPNNGGETSYIVLGQSALNR